MKKPLFIIITFCFLTSLSIAGNSTPVLIRDVCIGGSCLDNESEVEGQFLAWNPMTTGGQTVAAGGASADPCSGGSPGDPGDEICESFEDEVDGYKDTWTELTSGVGAAVTAKATDPQNFGCDYKGSYVVKLEKTTNDGYAGIRATLDNPENDQLYIEFAVMVASHALAAGESIVTFVLSNSTTGNEILYMNLNNDGGTVKWEFIHKDGGGSMEDDYWDGGAISTTTWYRHKILWEYGQGSDGVEWYTAIDDGSYSQQTIVDTSTRNWSFDYVYHGNDDNNSTTEPYTMYIDNSIIDDDAHPGVCNQ